jgi:hypothetical protein
VAELILMKILKRERINIKRNSTPVVNLIVFLNKVTIDTLMRNLDLFAQLDDFDIIELKSWQKK